MLTAEAMKTDAGFKPASSPPRPRPDLSYTCSRSHDLPSIGHTHVNMCRDVGIQYAQERALLEQMELVSGLGLPLMLYSTAANDALADKIREYREQRYSAGGHGSPSSISPAPGPSSLPLPPSDAGSQSVGWPLTLARLARA